MRHRRSAREIASRSGRATRDASRNWIWVLVALFALVSVFLVRQSCGRQVAGLYGLFDSSRQGRSETLDQGLPGTLPPNADGGGMPVRSPARVEDGGVNH